MKSKPARETQSDRVRDIDRALRFGAERLCLWCLCGSAACLRAKACRGDVHHCAGRIVAWLAAVEAERRKRPGFTAIENEIKTPERLRAYRAWRRAIASHRRKER